MALNPLEVAADGAEPTRRSLSGRLSETVNSYLPTSLSRDDEGTKRATQITRLSTASHTDEERVIAIVEERGGRVKQANVVATTGWSDAKVSRLLTSMEADGQINRYRIGREKVVMLPDQRPLE